MFMSYVNQLKRAHRVDQLWPTFNRDYDFPMADELLAVRSGVADTTSKSLGRIALSKYHLVFEGTMIFKERRVWPWASVIDVQKNDTESHLNSALSFLKKTPGLRVTVVDSKGTETVMTWEIPGLSFESEMERRSTLVYMREMISAHRLALQACTESGFTLRDGAIRDYGDVGNQVLTEFCRLTRERERPSYPKQ